MMGLSRDTFYRYKSAIDDGGVEALFNKKPSVRHLNTFGCMAYAHVPKQLRQNLDSKATKCRMIGYCKKSKGYKLFNIEKKTFFNSRYVSFNENEFQTTNC